MTILPSKKGSYIFTVCALLISSSFSYAQQNQYWTTHGNDVSTNEFIGTLNQAPLILTTGGEPRLQIYPTGRIGIGLLDEPKALLDVNGGTYLRGDLTLPVLGQVNSASSGTFELLLRDQSGVVKSGAMAMLADVIYQPKLCPPGVIANPTWANGENKIYTYCPQVFVGINTSTPRVHLDVRGSAYSERIALGADPTAFTSERLKIKGFSPASNSDLVKVENASSTLFTLSNQGDMSLWGKFEITSFDSKPLVINSSTEKILQLESDGLLRVRRLKIDHDSWADYVFEKDYNLMPLSEVKTYIEANHHLPEIPSTSEVKEEGLDVGQMNELLLKKVEELTLYVIQQQEEIEGLKKKFEEDSK